MFPGSVLFNPTVQTYRQLYFSFKANLHLQDLCPEGLEGLERMGVVSWQGGLFLVSGLAAAASCFPPPANLHPAHCPLLSTISAAILSTINFW